jgi:actin-related protein
MFNPAVLGKNEEGIHDVLSTCIKNVDMSMRRQMYSNILISGGVAEFDGFEERLDLELTKSSPERAPVNIETSSKPEISSWLGATILGEAPGTRAHMVSKAEYEEEGFRAVQRKFR